MAERIPAETGGESIRDIVRRFWPYTRGDRGRLLLSAILAIFVTISEIGTVIVFQRFE